MKKLLSIILILILSFTLIVGCTSNDVNEGETDTPQEENSNENTNEADTATGPSYVTDEASMEEVMGPDGTWIIIFTEDMTTDKEMVLDGEFKKDNEITRKIAAYAQDEQRNKTERYVITAPKLTIKSENAKFVGGTFKGDVYVEANDFTVQDGTIDGNVYFSQEEFQSSYQVVDDGKVTGETEIEE